MAQAAEPTEAAPPGPVQRWDGAQVDWNLAHEILEGSQYKATLIDYLYNGVPTFFSGTPPPPDPSIPTMAAEQALLPQLHASVRADIQRGRLRNITAEIHSGAIKQVQPCTLRAVMRTNNKIRIIEDYSQHDGQGRRRGVNAGIDTSGCPRDCPLGSLTDARNAILKIRERHPDDAILMSVSDFKEYFYHLPLREPDNLIYQVHYDGETYSTTALPMGSKGSPHPASLISTEINEGIERILRMEKGEDIYLITYVDDTMLISLAPIASELRERQRDYYARLALPSATGKPKLDGPPSTTAEFLGVMFDSTNGTMTLLEDRWKAIMAELHEALSQATSYTDMAHLIGRLQHITHLIPLGKVYLHNSHKYVASLAIHRNRKRNLPRAVREELLWWHSVLKHGPPTAKMERRKRLSAMTIHTDASLWGAGAVHDFPTSSTTPQHSVAQYARWPVGSVFTSRDQTTLELAAVVYTIEHNINSIRHKVITIKSDNSAVCDVIARGHARSPSLQPLTRYLMCLLAQEDVSLHAEWTPKEQNHAADYLSRLFAPQDHAGQWQADSTIPPTPWQPMFPSPSITQLLASHIPQVW